MILFENKSLASDKLFWLCARCFMVFLLSACASQLPPAKNNQKSEKPVRDISLARVQAEGAGREVVMYALGLLDVDYQFGGKNPEAGLDCSGMVRFIYKEAVGMDLPHNAVELAKKSRSVARGALRAGDLVFFNTRGFSYSHVGIYLGDDKFVHAPSTRGHIRVESLATPYYAQRFQGGRTLM